MCSPALCAHPQSFSLLLRWVLLLCHSKHLCRQEITREWAGFRKLQFSESPLDGMLPHTMPSLFFPLKGYFLNWAYQRWCKGTDCFGVEVLNKDRRTTDVLFCFVFLEDLTLWGAASIEGMVALGSECCQPLATSWVCQAVSQLAFLPPAGLWSWVAAGHPAGQTAGPELTRKGLWSSSDPAEATYVASSEPNPNGGAESDLPAFTAENRGFTS